MIIIPYLPENQIDKRVCECFSRLEYIHYSSSDANKSSCTYLCLQLAYGFPPIHQTATAAVAPQYSIGLTVQP